MLLYHFPEVGILSQIAHESALISRRDDTDFIDLTTKSSAESAPEGRMTRPSVPLRQCRGHHDDGWRNDPGEEKRERERQRESGGIISAKQQSYITTASAVEGVLHRHTNRCCFERHLGFRFIFMYVHTVDTHS